MNNEKENVTIEVGTWYKGETAEAVLTEETGTEVIWSSSDDNVATVNPYSGQIYGKSEGTATIYATATDGSGTNERMAVTVSSTVSVRSVTVCPQTLTMYMDELASLTATVLPANATNKTVTWTSSNNSVATVNATTGIITPLKKGTTRITAKTADGGYTSSCVVTVDPHEKVRVVRDGDYFYVRFAGDKYWKSIGCDLSLKENGSGNDLTNADHYQYLNDSEKHYLFNKERQYSVKQLSFLFMLDPYGVQYYLDKGFTNFDSGANSFDQKLVDYLCFKDDIYTEIFGITPRFFSIDSNGKRVPANTSLARNHYYSDAEIIFGLHTTPECVTALGLKILDIMFDLVKELTRHMGPQWSIPAKIASATFDVISKICFAQSIMINLNSSDLMVDSWDTFLNNVLDGTQVSLDWVNDLLLFIGQYRTGGYTKPTPSELTIYHKIKADNNYKAIFSRSNSTMTIEEIVEAVESI